MIDWRDKRGFTLVELLITLSIMAIVIGIMTPKISALFPNAGEMAGTRVRHAVMKARWISARDQVPVFLVFDRKTQKIELFEREKGKEKTLFTITLPAGMKMVRFWNPDPETAGRMTLQFLPDGRGEGFGLLLEDGDSRLTVMGFPFRPGVTVVSGWVEGAPHAA